MLIETIYQPSNTIQEVFEIQNFLWVACHHISWSHCQMILFNSCELVGKSKQRLPFSQHALHEAMSCYKRALKKVFQDMGRITLGMTVMAYPYLFILRSSFLIQWVLIPTSMAQHKRSIVGWLDFRMKHTHLGERKFEPESRYIVRHGHGKAEGLMFWWPEWGNLVDMCQCHSTQPKVLLPKPEWLWSPLSYSYALRYGLGWEWRARRTDIFWWQYYHL